MPLSITFNQFLETESHWDLRNMTRADVGMVRGFVYRIISRETEKFYIGCKLTSVKNWPSYKGSSKRLKTHMEENPADTHDYQVIMTVSDKNAAIYGETSMQIITNALHRDDSWNEAISSQRWVSRTEGTMQVSSILDRLPLQWFDRYCLFLPTYTSRQVKD